MNDVARIVLMTLAVLAVIFFVAPAVIHWYDCRQLAPIERAFVRGC